MKVFKAMNFWEAEIKEVEIKGMTNNFVKLSNSKFRRRREAITSSYHYYCKTYEEAKQWLIRKAKDRLEQAEKSVIDHRNRLDKIRKL